MITFRNTSVFFLAWMVVSMVTFIANLDSTGSDSFTDLSDSAFSVETVEVDDSPIEILGVSTGIELPKPQKGWVGNIVKTATFQSPIWDDGWTNIIRVVLVTIGGAYLLALIVKGLEIIAQFIPG